MPWHEFRPGDTVFIDTIVSVCRRRLTDHKTVNSQEMERHLETIAGHEADPLVYHPVGPGWGASPFNPNVWRVPGRAVANHSGPAEADSLSLDSISPALIRSPFDSVRGTLPFLSVLTTKERRRLVHLFPDLATVPSPAHISSRSDLEAFTHALSLLAPSHPDVALTDAIGNLHLLADQPIPRHQLTTRLNNALKGKFNRWVELADRTYADLVRMRAIGKGSACHLWQIAMLEGLRVEGGAEIRGPSETTNQTDSLQSNSPHAALLRSVAAWGYGSLGLSTFGDLFERSPSIDDAPPEIMTAVQTLEALSLAELAGSLASHYSVSESLQSLLKRLDQRQLQLLTSRICQPEQPATLHALGTRLGVTRERVRQLEQQLIREIATYLGSAEARPLVRRSAEVRARVKQAFPIDSYTYRTTLAQLTAGLDTTILSAEAIGYLLLYLAGPYRASGGWLITASSAQQLQEAANSLRSRAQDSPVPIEEARKLIKNLEILDEHKEAWIASAARLRVFRGHLVPAASSVITLCELILRDEGEPMEFITLFAQLPSTYDRRSVRNRLLADNLFMRTGKDQIGLRTWNVEEYSSIADELSERIEANGGVAPTAVLIQEISTTFQVSANSVNIVLRSPRFVIDSRHSTARLRRSDEPYLVDTNLAAATDCYQTAAGWAHRIEVDSNLTRGSGIHIPEAFCVLLGIGPGGKSRLIHEFGAVLVSWPDSSTIGPTLGSLRSVLENQDASIGDFLFVQFGSDRKLSFYVVRASELASSTKLRALALMVGIRVVPESTSETIADIAKSLSIQLPSEQGVVPRAQIRAVLAARGETRLAALLPPGRESEDDALRRLAASLT